MNQDLSQKFLQLRKKVLEKHFCKMNEPQQSALFQVKGPVLILAGAGSGKTTVVVNRIANLVEFGNAYHSTFVPPRLTEDDVAFLEGYLAGSEDDYVRMRALIAAEPVNPWNILAITFTNKAAGELKQRLEDMLGETAKDIQASTFHSACVRILRREIEQLGYDKSFTIYDTDDSLRVIKDGLKTLGLSDKNFTPKSILSAISSAKDSFIDPVGMENSAAGDYRQATIAKVYDYYVRQLKSANALDFDDIIVLTVELFRQFPQVLSYYQNRFRYVMVDEYQDTNNCQYMLVSLLTQEHQNICVVGDDDQSIYKFRGATIENILSFEEQFPGAKVIRLEQNYRCTQTILDAANAVISHNTQRKGKNLWTQNDKGEQVKIFRAYNELDESQYIAQTILTNVSGGQRFSDHAILYRMNAQSNTIETAMLRSGIPYRIIGGQRFYERKEIKDTIAYLSVINNSADTVRLKRIINEPKRGLGDSTIAKAQEIADALGISMYEVMRTADNYQPLGRKAQSLMEFIAMLEGIAGKVEESSLSELLDMVLDQTGYRNFLVQQGEEGLTRLENVEELKTNMMKYEQENEEHSLSGFLEEVSLYTDLDNYDAGADAVIMMTMHSAKGLEFNNVFLCGAEEGIFPGVQTMYNEDEVQEERRLAYVCITRARKQFYISNAVQRMLFGQTSRNRMSRFVGEIPIELCEINDKTIDKYKVQKQNQNSKKPPMEVGGNSRLGIGVQKDTSAFNVRVGDSVQHKTFGQGMVLTVRPMGNDHLVEVAFETAGTKKIMAKFAKLTKI